MGYCYLRLPVVGVPNKGVMRLPELIWCRVQAQECELLEPAD